MILAYGMQSDNRILHLVEKLPYRISIGKNVERWSMRIVKELILSECYNEDFIRQSKSNTYFTQVFSEEKIDQLPNKCRIGNERV